MPEVKIAYETYGRLADDADHPWLHQQPSRCRPVNGNQRGWWDGLIGPGKAIDIEKLFVVSSNMLGSSFGSTNGASINPDTGKPMDRIFRQSQ